MWTKPAENRTRKTGKQIQARYCKNGCVVKSRYIQTRAIKLKRFWLIYWHRFELTKEGNDELTIVAHDDTVVHDVAQHGHNNAEQCEENPIFSYFGKGISPNEGNEPKEAWSPFAAVGAQLFAPLLFLLFACLLGFAKLGRLLSRVFSKTPRIASVHLVLIWRIVSK